MAEIETKQRFTADGTEYVRELDKLEGKTKGFSSAVNAAIKTAVAIYADLKVGISAAFLAYKEQEKAEQRIRGLIAATGAAAGVTTKQVTDMATAYSQATTFSDDAILSGQAILLTFKRIKDEGFERATKASIDLAAALGTDVASSARVLGKALNDPTQGLTALSRAGIQFTETQKKAIQSLVDTGKVAEAQDVIFKKLEGTVGGVAEQMAQGTGSIDQLKNAVGELQESVGQALAPEIVAVTLYLKDFILSIQQNSDKFLEYKAVAIATFSAVASTVREFLDVVVERLLFFPKLIYAVFESISQRSLEPLKVFGREVLNVFTKEIPDIFTAGTKAYNDSIRETFARDEGFKKAQEKVARISGLQGKLNDDLVAKETAFQKRISDAIKKGADLRSELEAKPAQKRYLAELELSNKLVELQNKTNEQRLINESFTNEQELILRQTHSLELQELRRQLQEAEFESQLSDEELLSQIRAEKAIEEQNKENELRKKRIADEDGFSKRRLDTENATLSGLLGLYDNFSNLSQLADTTSYAERGKIWSNGLGSILDLMTEFGVDNEGVSKGIAIAQIAVQTAADAFGFLAKEAGNGGWAGWALGLVGAGLITAQGVMAISKVKNTKFNPGGFAQGSGGSGMAAPGERFMSTFSGREIVIPETFSQAIRKGDLSLAGPGQGSEGGGRRMVNLNISLKGDAGRFIQYQQNESEALGVLPATF